MSMRCCCCCCYCCCCCAKSCKKSREWRSCWSIIVRTSCWCGSVHCGQAGASHTGCWCCSMHGAIAGAIGGGGGGAPAGGAPAGGATGGAALATGATKFTAGGSSTDGRTMGSTSSTPLPWGDATIIVIIAIIFITFFELLFVCCLKHRKGQFPATLRQTAPLGRSRVLARVGLGNWCRWPALTLVLGLRSRLQNRLWWSQPWRQTLAQHHTSQRD